MGNFTEADIKTKYILPAIQAAGWDLQTQVREEVSFTHGRIIVRGKMADPLRQTRSAHHIHSNARHPLDGLPHPPYGRGSLIPTLDDKETRYGNSRV